MVKPLNPFVSYLNRYTTISSEHEAAFDEFITQTPPPVGGSLRLETKTEKFLHTRFEQPHPPSIILTGNAGDGKTYLCRQIIRAFTGEEVTEWRDQVEWLIQREGMKLYVIKDLSEIGETAGSDILRRLAASLSVEQVDSIFLIAANEGRLRALLSRDDNLKIVREKVSQQLKGGLDQNNSQLIVLDLNQVMTSAYVPQVLSWLTQTDHWDSCQNCTAFESCPIRFNAIRLKDTHVAARLKRLYQILESLGIHITIRDMLIHLAYTFTGGLSCERVIDQVHEVGKDFHEYAYFENVWGEMVDNTSRRRVSVAYNLQRLNVGKQSLFEVDNFVINGGSYEGEVKAEYERLFKPSVDLGDRRFIQDRDNYLRGSSKLPHSEDNHPLLRWLPHCRRKLFFEWEETKKADQLVPFLFWPKYLELLDGDAMRLERTCKEMILGINRAFSNLYLNDSENLYVTSQYARAVEQSVPLVKVKLPQACITLRSKHISAEAFDCDHKEISFEILPPPGIQAKPIGWPVDLLRFEYLMRLAQGGTYNVLKTECDLAIRQLKNQLWTRFSRPEKEASKLTFFAAERHHYQMKELQVDQDRVQI